MPTPLLAHVRSRTALACAGAAVVYYPIAYWVWGGGWLAALGAMDFAGGITIHSVAGWAGMIVSLMLQKRRNIEKLEMTHHNIPMLVTGGTIVWAGWYTAQPATNPCSTPQPPDILSPAPTQVLL